MTCALCGLHCGTRILPHLANAHGVRAERTGDGGFVVIDTTKRGMR